MTIQCKKCGAEFETGPEVGVHARAEHSKSAVEGEDVPYYCYGCDTLFDDFGDLHRSHWSHSPTLADKQAAYDRMIESFLRMGFEARVDDKGVTGYHLP